jgi:hypothetical protein
MWWLLVACKIPSPPGPPPADALEAPVPVAAPAPPPEPQPTTPTEPAYAATVLRVAWAGAVDAPPAVTRTREEARTLAIALRARAAAGDDLGALARAHSDEPLGRRGGQLGVWRTGTMVDGLERAVAGTPVGDLAAVAETPYGWYVARREAVDGRRFGQIHVAHAGSWRARTDRTEGDAHDLAALALARLERGEPLTEVAQAVSSGGAADADLGPLVHGQWIPALEDAADALGPGGRALVHSPYGWHVVVRLDGQAED